MASTFRLKRKTYSDNQNQNNQGSGWGKKLAIGAGIAAAGFMGAKTGMLGNKAQLWANRRVMGVGRALGKESTIGQKLVNNGKEGVNSAIKGMREARANEIISKNLN
jgi:hypothetical protein